LDVVWAGDFMEAGFNSVWLLPNRLYEGGYYGVPPIAPAGTETAAWIDQRATGFTVSEDLSATLPALIAKLIAEPALIAARRDALLALPEETFVQPPGALSAIIADALQTTTGDPSADLQGQAA